MTDAGTISTIAERSETGAGSPAGAARPALGPPGVVFYVVTIIAIVVALDTNSRQSVDGLMATAVLWAGLAVTWFGRFAVALGRSTFSLGELRRWVIIPVLLGVVVALTRTSVVIDARLDLSRPALDQLAREVMAGGSTERGWVGLYDVSDLELTANGFWFTVGDGFFARHGLAYAPDGAMPVVQGWDDSMWSGPGFESVGGGWWRFIESF